MSREAASAEDLARPSYKWIWERLFVRNLQGWSISLFPGGIGFSVFDYSPEKALRVCLSVEREDGATEPYLADAYYVGEWGGGFQKWQTRPLPVFPYEGLHGLARAVTFSYSVLKDGLAIPSRFRYRFAALEDFYRGRLAIDDFEDPAFRRENDEPVAAAGDAAAQEAYDRMNARPDGFSLTPLFTRGNQGRPDHPVRAVHAAIDRVIEEADRKRGARPSILLAVFDFDNEHVTRHLVYAKEKGVEVECIGDWAQVSPMNASENIARLRRAGIRVYGVIRNDPARPEDIVSMHTKFIVFGDDEVHSGSYNLHFHLWGGNWEGGLAYASADAAVIYRHIYHAIRFGLRVRLDVDPAARHNIYYSFGAYRADGSQLRPQDAIITEIENAGRSIVVCMFEIGPIRGAPNGRGPETDVIGALIRARDRGVRVRVIVNGMVSHTGPEPEPWDKDMPRPLKAPLNRLKDAWIEVYYVYYHESIHSPLHHKFAVFDEMCVIAGSYNWYEPSLYSDEILTVTRDARIASAFLDETELILRSFRIRRG